MDNFSTEQDKPADKKSGAVDMSVSPICIIDKKKKAYVSFQADGSMAEGLIPDCKITKNKGFSDEEVGALEDYMRTNLSELKKMAANVNVMKAFMNNP